MSITFEARQAECLFHSNFRSQSRTDIYRVRLAELGATSSLSRADTPTGSARVESLFNALRSKRCHHTIFKTCVVCAARGTNHPQLYGLRRLRANYLSSNEYQTLQAKCA